MASERRTSGIVTPEAVLLEFDTAGVGSRAVARVIDTALQVALAATLAGMLETVGRQFTHNMLAVSIVTASITAAVALLGYPILLETRWGGRTVGKAALGLRVVSRQGAPAGFRHAATRAVLALIEVYTLPAVAIISTALSPANQRVGDLASGAIVVREASGTNSPLAFHFPPPRGWESYTRTLDVSGMTVGQYRVIRSFLLRVLVLSPEARARIALRLANPLARSLRHHPPPHLGPELFLVCAASAYQTRHGGGLPLPVAGRGGGGPPDLNQ